MPDALFTVHTPEGRVHVVTRPRLAACPAWVDAFRGHRQDHRYYAVVEDTIQPALDFRYLILEDLAGRTRAVQPVFVVDQDILEGAGRIIRKAAGLARRAFPRLLTMRTLMLGCAAGEGHLDAAGERDDAPDTAYHGGRLLHAALPEIARRLGASLTVFKEFPHADRPTLEPFATNGYARLPSFPMTRLELDYPNFDAYLTTKLSKNARKSLRRNLREAQARGPVTMEVLTDVTPVIDEVYPLYLQVFGRATLKFEKLTKEYLCRLGQDMPDRARFFVWRLNEEGGAGARPQAAEGGTPRGRAVAFSVCMEHGDTLYDLYLGLEYPLALELHLYFLSLRDTLSWAIDRRLKWYVSTPLGYDPKLHLGCHLVPLDLYVRHRSPVINFFMRRLMPLLGPTRGDKTLQKFPNYADLAK